MGNLALVPGFKTSFFSGKWQEVELVRSRLFYYIEHTFLHNNDDNNNDSEIFIDIQNKI